MSENNKAKEKTIKTAQSDTAQPDAMPITSSKAAPVAKASPGVVYDVASLVAAARSQFKCAPELVATALRLACKETCTLEEAKDIVAKFKERKVK